MKKKLLLVSPKSFAVAYQDMKFTNYITNKAEQFMNVSLATVAALTPSEFDIKIIDENIESINFKEIYDLVGISGYQTQLKRAQEIAGEFASTGALIVCGGASVSVSPERWRTFSDVLIIGEAERIWPQFIKDYLNGRHKQEYREKEKIDLSLTPVPDYSGISTKNKKQFFGGIVQTSRGCPFMCEFCDVIVYVGRKMRYKSVNKIIEEIEQIYKIGLRLTLLANDNFSANRQKAKEILVAVRNWNKQQSHPMSFITQLSIDIAEDDEFLELAAEAGLNRVFIGLETPNVDSLKETRKLQNVDRNLIGDVKKFNEYGILVLSGSVIGFDHDDLTIFEKQFEFFMNTGIPNVHVYPLQAPDGTPLKERMIKEGRYLDEYMIPAVKSKYSNLLNTFTIAPKLMTLAQLYQGTVWLVWQFYRMDNFIKRLMIFFNNYENSPKKEKLSIPHGNLSKESLGILWRIFKYYIFKAYSSERKALRQIFKRTMRSSHPQALEIAIGSFLAAKNIQEMLRLQVPEINSISYPERAVKE